MITSPTVGLTRTVEGTGVTIARRNRGEVAPTAWYYRCSMRQRGGTRRCRCPRHCRRARGGACYRTRPRLCRRWLHTTRADQRRHIPIDRITHAELAGGVPAPTIDRTRTVKRADVANPSIDCRKRHPCRHGDGHRSRAIEYGGAVAELASPIRPPTIGYTRTGYRTGLIVPCANRRNG